MAVIDRLKWDSESDEILVWKHPSEELALGTQVIVNQSQEAFFVKNGVVLDCLGPGNHTLVTGNIPLLNKLINLPFGGKTPFTAEVWYVSKTVKRDLKWGTPSPIPLFDPSVGFPINLRSYGKWGIRLDDSKSFLTQIVGTLTDATAEKVNQYFTGEIIQKLSSVLATAVSGNQISVFNLTASINEISKLAFTSIKDEFDRFGLELINFNIESVNIPEDEMQKIQEVFAKKMEAEQLSKADIGQNYATIKTFETLKTAAENPGEGGGGVGGMLGAGIGIGAGLPIGQSLGNQMNITSQQQSNTTEKSVQERLLEIKNLFEQGLISQEQFDSKQKEILKDL